MFGILAYVDCTFIFSFMFGILCYQFIEMQVEEMVGVMHQKSNFLTKKITRYWTLPISVTYSQLQILAPLIIPSCLLVSPFQTSNSRHNLLKDHILKVVDSFDIKDTKSEQLVF